MVPRELPDVTKYTFRHRFAKDHYPGGDLVEELDVREEEWSGYNHRSILQSLDDGEIYVFEFALPVGQRPQMTTHWSTRPPVNVQECYEQLCDRVHMEATDEYNRNVVIRGVALMSWSYERVLRLVWWTDTFLNILSVKMGARQLTDGR